ncbi:MAG: hypothetical protein WC263_03735 [Candidatus Micrarchaeia archaeon]
MVRASILPSGSTFAVSRLAIPACAASGLSPDKYTRRAAASGTASLVPRAFMFSCRMDTDKRLWFHLRGKNDNKKLKKNKRKKKSGKEIKKREKKQIKKRKQRKAEKKLKNKKKTKKLKEGKRRQNGKRKRN